MRSFNSGLRWRRSVGMSFNVFNGDVEPLVKLWPKVAKKFGCKVSSRQFERPTPGSSEMKVPPVENFAEKTGTEGKVGQGAVEQRIDLMKWSQSKETKEAWERVAEMEGLERDAFEKATWGFLWSVLGRNYDIVVSMSKARKLGWTGYKDTWKALEETFDELAREVIVPKGV